MTEKGKEPIVGRGREHMRLGPEASREIRQLRDRRAARLAGRGQQPWPAGKQVGTCVLESALCRAAQWMAADEGEPRRQGPRCIDHGSLRPACVGDDGRLPDVVVEIREERDVLSGRRGKNHEVGLCEHDQIVCSHIDRVPAHRLFEHVLVVDTDNERTWPDLAGGQSDRSADQAQADDADLLENRPLPLAGAAGLNDWKFHCGLRIDDCGLQSSIPFLTIPIRGASPVPGRCCGRSRAR